jgi:hypothetical protein
MDKQKVSKESFDAYRAWLKFIRKAHPKLSEGLVKSTLYSYCAAMASDGTNGLGCYTSDATIADDLELYDYRSVAPYRHEAMRLGWFVWNGERKGRAKVLDIAIPADEPNGSGRENSPPVTEHDPGATSLLRCSACKPLLDSGVSLEKIVDLHTGRLGVSDA